MLHPQAAAWVEAAADDLAVTDPTYDVAAAREESRRINLAEPRPDVAVVRDLDAGGVPVRLYAAADGAGARGVVVHLHGGGFVLGDVDVHDRAARHLALETGMAVVSVDYRRPPEHPFPAAPDDVDAVLGWLAADGAAEGLTGPLCLHGDSAGGNLALVAALRNPGRAVALALVYPFVDARMRGASYATARGLDRGTAQWYWEQYAGGADRLADLLDEPDLSPIEAGDPALAGLPPTLVTTAEYDPLLWEGEDLARRIAAAGGHAVCTRYLGQVHGFWRHVAAFDAALPMLVQVAGFLRLHTGSLHRG